MVINELHYNLLQRKNEFVAAAPYPHIVLDNFLTEEHFIKVISESSRSQPSLGKNFDSDVEKNKSISLNSQLPTVLSDIIQELNSPKWIENLRHLTGILDLSGTDNGNSLLANFHVMKSNGILGSHVDHGAEPSDGRAHVLNIIIYLSENWLPEYGGHTQLYNSKGSAVVSEVINKPNRALIFLHTPYSFHGVSKLNDDITEPRKTLYIDYYSASLTPYSHLRLSFPNLWFNHVTTFKLSQYIDYLKPANFKYVRRLTRYNLTRKISEISALFAKR